MSYTCKAAGRFGRSARIAIPCSKRILEMKTFKTVAVIVLIVLFASCLVTAQSQRPATWKTEVPFAFHVGNHEFPAGAYLVGRDGPFMSIRSVDKKFVASFLVVADDSRQGSRLNTLKFEEYGNEHFLSGIFFGDSGEGGKLYLSKPEVELAKHAGAAADTAVGQ